MTTVFPKARWIASKKLRLVENEIDHVMGPRIIRSTISLWASSLHVVPKKNSNCWCWTGDYRPQNAKATLDRRSLPHIRGLTANLKGVVVYDTFVGMFELLLKAKLHSDLVKHINHAWKIICNPLLKSSSQTSSFLHSCCRFDCSPFSSVSKNSTSHAWRRTPISDRVSSTQCSTTIFWKSACLKHMTKLP